MNEHSILIFCLLGSFTLCSSITAMSEKTSEGSEVLSPFLTDELLIPDTQNIHSQCELGQDRRGTRLDILKGDIARYKFQSHPTTTLLFLFLLIPSEIWDEALCRKKMQKIYLKSNCIIYAALSTRPRILSKY